jgi:hypothetical protein
VIVRSARPGRAAATIETAMAGGTMVYILIGIALLVGTAALFWRFLPRNGECHWLARSAWAPYLGIAFTSGFAFGIAVTVTGIVQLFS